jgi:hypothetical protein
VPPAVDNVVKGDLFLTGTVLKRLSNSGNALPYIAELLT